jgi:hypothetical protein
MQYESPPAWKLSFLAFCRQHKSLAWIANREERTFQRSLLAADAFQLLGRDGNSAIPTLICRLRNPKAPRSASRAAKALGCLGKEAVPPLVDPLTNPEFFKDALPAIPSLRQALKDEDDVIRMVANSTLQKISRAAGTNAPNQSP